MGKALHNAELSSEVDTCINSIPAEKAEKDIK